MVFENKPQEPRQVKVYHQPAEPQEPRTIHLEAPSDRPTPPQPTPSGNTRTVFHFTSDQDTPQAAKRPSDFPRAFYTIPQLAAELQVHENTIYRLVRAGKVEHYKVGAQIRIAAAELERLKVERKA